MTTRVIPTPSPVMDLARALTSSFKRPGRVSALPALTLEMPGIVIRQERLDAYARVCGFQVQPQAPLTYPQLLAFPLVMAYVTQDSPWPAMGTVHLANSITQHHPLKAGETFRAQLDAGELLSHDKGQVYTLELSLWRETDGVCVWQACQTLLRIGVSPAAGPAWKMRVDAALPLQVVEEFDVPADIGRRYARVSGDLNPIHLSALSARCLGFRRAIAHGLWTQARALSLLHPDGVACSARLRTDFKRPLFLPSRVQLAQAQSPASETVFEVRDSLSDAVHLRSELNFSHPHTGKLT